MGKKQKNPDLLGAHVAFLHIAWEMETPEEGEEWADTEDIASGGHRSQGCHRGLVLEGHNTIL